MFSILRNAAVLLVAGTASATAQVVAAIASDGAIDVPAPATALLVGAAVGGAMLVKAYRNRR
ncbi:MAG: hypothetical protein JNK67_31195 [Alphaproteobacteria bacterium]|nr:hypothetical protein [Alphaproteobacteria bacterium]